MTRTPWLWKTEAFLLIFFWLTDEWGLYFGTAQFFGFFLFFLNHQQQHKIGEKFLLLSWHVWRLPFGRSSIGLVKFASCPSPVHSTPDSTTVVTGLALICSRVDCQWSETLDSSKSLVKIIIKLWWSCSAEKHKRWP